MAGGLIVSVFFYIIVGSLPYDIKHLELTVVVIRHCVNKKEKLKLTENDTVMVMISNNNIQTQRVQISSHCSV